MTDSLLEKKCIPCEGTEPPLKAEEIENYMKKLPQPWEVLDNIKITKKFILTNFKEAIAFVNKVADLAENEGHHPDIFIYYKKVKFELWTHAIGGLSENDFILAAKIEEIYKDL